MTKINKRLGDLEHEAGKQCKDGFMVLYKDPEGGYFEKSPYSPDPGRHYTEEENEAMTKNLAIVFIVRYVDN